MKKHKLYAEISYDFGLIGISSHEKPYKLAWAINEIYGTNFSLAKELLIQEKGEEEAKTYARYTHTDENEVSFTLFSNKAENGYLIKELSTFDYFLQLTGNYSKEIRDEWIINLKKIDLVNTALKIDPNCLKNKDRFLM